MTESYWNTPEGLSRRYEDTVAIIQEAIDIQDSNVNRACHLAIEAHAKLMDLKSNVDTLPEDSIKAEWRVKLKIQAERLAYDIFEIPRPKRTVNRTPPAPVPTPWRTNGKTD